MKTPENRFGGSLNFGQSPSEFAQALKPGSSYRNYLEEVENKIGPLHYFAKTYTMMRWVYEIATNKIL